MDTKPIKDIEFERVYDASPETVWHAWTDPEKLKQWWGPENVSITTCAVDLRVGGLFSITMEAGEAMGPYKGTQWPMRATFTVVEPYSKLSYEAQAWTEGQKEETMIDQVTELSLSEENGKTKVKVHAAIYKTGPKATMAVEGMQQGFTEHLEKLNTFLSK